jgi:hypothetical protein
MTVQLFCAATPLLDHLVSGGQQRFRDGEAERFGGLEVDDKFDFCRRPADRLVSRPSAGLSHTLPSDAKGEIDRAVADEFRP